MILNLRLARPKGLHVPSQCVAMLDRQIPMDTVSGSRQAHEFFSS